ncbi:MAG TPA: hypothetical protein VNF27_01845 [Candidatus Binataceae bacterium]|nr:hypothetical protein [Candidatus Binataceae bacterium]
MEIKIARKVAIAIVAAAVACTFTTAGFAAPSESDIPATSVVPAAPNSGASGAPSPSAPAGESAASPGEVAAPAAARKKPAAPRFKFNPADVEPGNARAKLLEDTWAYVEPAKSSAHVERVVKDKYLVVTGATHYFVQVKLKSGKTAYVEQSAVDLVKPVDKIFKLTHNAAVLDMPNRWGKKVAEVHTPHDVHVVGIALNYIKIRMKNGVEGFIPSSALE